MGFSITIFTYELFEIVLLFLGISTFQNKLSLFQIVFHVIASMLYIWYIFLDWEGIKMWVIFLFAAGFPFFFELGGILYSILFYGKVLRLN